MTHRLEKLFNRTRSVMIGMVHVRALPGSPSYHKNLQFNDIVAIAKKEADIYAKANLDGIMIENMYDLPWLQSSQIQPETLTHMTVICDAIRRFLPSMPLGVQVLSAANKQALAIAKATGLNFIRAEGYVYAHIGDEGIVQSCAGELTRYRKQIEAEDIQIFTDIKKKHCSHAITYDVSITDTAKAAELFLSDGVVVSGNATGEITDPKEISAVQSCVRIPTLVGSGVTEDNVQDYIHANALIIGTHLKMHGIWSNDLDDIRVTSYMKKVHKLRKQLRDSFGRSLGPDDDFRPLTAQGE